MSGPQTGPVRALVEESPVTVMVDQLSLVEEATQALRAERYAHARRLWHGLLSNLPGSASVADPVMVARLYAGLAASYAGLAEFEQATSNASKALALDPHQPRALAVLGYIADVVDRNPNRAIDYFRAAVQATRDHTTGPSTADEIEDAAVHLACGTFLLRYERYDEARVELQQARQLDPDLWRADLALSRYMAGSLRRQLIRDAYRSGVAQNPSSPRLRLGLILATLASFLPGGSSPTGTVAAGSARVLPTSAQVEDQEWAVRQLLSRKRPWLTYTILVINFAVFAWVESHGGSQDTNTLLTFGAKDNALIIQGQWWRLFTPMFLHAGFEHIAGNSLSIFFIGPLIESIFGRPRMLFLYLFSGVCGNLCTFAFDTYLSVGASTAIAGMVAALIVYFGSERRLLGRYAIMQFRFIIVVVFVNILLGRAGSTIDNYGHLGGFIGGLIAAVVLMPRFTIQRDLQSGQRTLWDRRRTAVMIVAALVLCVLLAALSALIINHEATVPVGLPLGT